MYKTYLVFRSILFYLWLALSAIFFTILLFIALPLPFRKGRMQISRKWCHLALLMGKWICGMKYEIIGLEHCPRNACIYIAKHQSAWETIALPGILPPNCFVAKESLLKIPFFGWGMRICKHIPIDRSSGMSALKKVLRLGKERITEGLSIIIFPEGTRVAPLEHPKFHKTATLLAKEARAPVIPIAHNSGSCWRRNSFIKYPGKITVIIGPVLDSTALTNEQINTQTYECIKKEMIRLEK